jgi:hypothetical protein
LRTTGNFEGPGGVARIGSAEMKIKYVLPAAQMVLLVLLLGWNNSLNELANRRCDMPGPIPADDLLMSMNAPLFVQRLLNYFLSYPWNVVAQIGAVGLFWYWVAVTFPLGDAEEG